MHKLLRKMFRCRRGTAAIATVIVLVPLIGAIALGGEAGSWYVTKRHAQNAADAAAMSGGLQLACDGNCGTPTFSDRGLEFAAQNGFCNAGYGGLSSTGCDTLASGTSQSVSITQITWSGAPAVQATVQQTQPAYLAKLLGFTTIPIGAQAIAQLRKLANPCALALSGSISFQGNPDIDTPNCGLASNSREKNAIDFTGGVHNFNVGSLSAAGGCQGTGNSAHCNKALTYTSPVTNPFAVLDTLGSISLPPPSKNKVFSQADLGLSTSTASCPNPLTAYSAATPCLNVSVSLNSAITVSGVYFISGSFVIKGNAHSVTVGPSGALFILLNGASFGSFTGNSTITLHGPASVTAAQLPPILKPYASVFTNMAIYDQTSAPTTFNGTSTLLFSGVLDFPNSAVTYQGNPTIASINCGEIIAASLAFNGHATFSDAGCAAAGTLTPTSQIVALVQ